jgi:hypothetical protein
MIEVWMRSDVSARGFWALSPQPPRPHNVNGYPARVAATEYGAMDMMSMVSSILGMQAGNTQTQVAATILQSNASAEKSTVLTLLGAAQQNMASLANVGAGVGGNVNISA